MAPASPSQIPHPICFPQHSYLGGRAVNRSTFCIARCTSRTGLAVRVRRWWEVLFPLGRLVHFDAITETDPADCLYQTILNTPAGPRPIHPPRPALITQTRRLSVHNQDVEMTTALSLYDKVEANLVKLERIWSRFEGRLYELTTTDDPELVVLLDRWDALVESLPPVDGFNFEAKPLLPTEATQWHIDANDIGFLDAKIDFDNALTAPGRELAVYRSRMEQARLRIVRQPVLNIITKVDSILDDVVINYDPAHPPAMWEGRTRWMELNDLTSTLVRLSGSLVPRKARWNDLQRHLTFAEPKDLFDIVKLDWPSIKVELNESLYDEWEPIPIQMEDLGTITPSDTQTPVSTRLDWSRLTEDRFEGLIFELFRSAEGYENANWPMRTNAPDRGRDIEVYRINQDSLSITRHLRVMIQCKHWLNRTIGRKDLINCIESIKLWEPPSVDILIIATSGRFSQDSVALAEKREIDGTRPLVELWYDSHIEGLLGHRPRIAAEFGLR